MALRRNLGDELGAWLLLRHLDRKRNKGTGRVKRSAAVRQIAILQDCSHRTALRIIQQGMGTFWKEGRGFLYLVGQVPLCEKLGVSEISSKWFLLPCHYLMGVSRNVRGLLACMVAARDERPVSVANLAGRCGISERTMWHYLDKWQKMGLFRAVKNYERIESFLELARAQSLLNTFEGDESWHCIATDGSSYYVCRRLPNTYACILNRSGTNRIRYRMMRRNGRPQRSPYQRLYAKGKEIGEKMKIGMMRDKYGPLFQTRNGRAIVIWEKR